MGGYHSTPAIIGANANTASLFTPYFPLLQSV